MIAIGIPTLNEADNIESLVKSLDAFSRSLDIPLIFINCDNSSEDGTSERFQAIATNNSKVAFSTIRNGKGRNLKKIVEYICENNISYCLFIDGDVTSTELEWIQKHAIEAEAGTDYVVPSYSRNMQEGNTTNHFAFPLLSHFTNGHSPRQPIAGDFGISLTFARHLNSVLWPPSAMGYGVDMFMTTHALFGGFKVAEIELGKKLHKPSYDKMVGMFTEVAESYYAVRELVKPDKKVVFSGVVKSDLGLIAGAKIAQDKIEQRLQVAQDLFKINTNSLPRIVCQPPKQMTLSSSDWAKVLLAHEKMLGIIAPSDLAKSLTPFYLVRSMTYLRDTDTPLQAAKEIELQAQTIHETFMEAKL